MKSYIKKIRKKIGHQKFIHPAARIIIENEKGQILFFKRKDNGNLGIPAGGLEEDEPIEECIIREVKEETGLEILNMSFIGLSSNPKNETVEYPNGDVIQYFVCEFYSNDFKGKIKADEIEVSKVEFLDISNFKKLPENERRTFESLDFFKKNGRVLIR